MDFKDRVVIITGSSRGIGKEIALAYVRAGANVTISSRSGESLKPVASEIESIGGKVLLVPADVSKPEDAKKLVENTIETFGKIDILINNAGITRDNLLLRLSEEDWDSVIDTNLKGAFNCLKAVTKQMMKQRHGSIINMSSVVGLMGNPGQVNYAASKAGLIGMTKSAAKELASRGIRVNAVAPGFIETDMTENLQEKAKDELMRAIPLGELGKVEDVANLVLFLTSEKARYITGQVINVDGGMLI